MVKAFNSLCHDNGLLSIIELVVRPPRRGAGFNREQAIIDAPKNWATAGRPCYKVRCCCWVKRIAAGTAGGLQKLNEHIAMPWVILFSGVDENYSPRAVSVAMQAGASGFF